jgi:hypothetical protein
MAAPAAYFDEDVPAPAARALRMRGFTVLTTSEAGALTASDDAQLLRATELGYVVVSHNRWHFRRLHEEFIRTGRAHGGIVLLPQDTNPDRLALRIALMLDWVGTQGAPTSRLWAWNACQQALIHGFRLANYSENDVSLALGRA